MAVDIKYLERSIEEVSEAASGLRDSNASSFPDDVANAIDTVHSTMEEIFNAIDDLNDRLLAIEAKAEPPLTNTPTSA